MAVVEQDPRIPVIAGREVPLPVHVRQAEQASATWSVDAGAAQAVIDGTGLQVVRNRRGRATASLALVDYQDNDLGAYHEVALAFVVRPHDAGPGYRADPRAPVTYIHRLPVDGEFTCAAGRGIWGFPKWVTDITWRRNRRGTDGVLIDDGRLVLATHVQPGWVPLPAQPLAMQCYSHLDGVLRRTPWTTTSHGARLRPGGATVVVGDGHPFADEVRSLGLHERAPLFTVTVERMTAEFGAAEVIGS